MKDIINFAIERHKDQGYGDKSYSHHLYMVRSICKQFNLPELIEKATYLHDILEDTPTTYDELKDRFGKDIADIVYCVTDEKGKNRKERKLTTYPKIRSNELAVGLKLCDRIANVLQCIEDCNIKLFLMYKKEHPQFREYLYKENEYTELWELLDNLINKDVY